jgi:hypothetical protein
MLLLGAGLATSNGCGSSGSKASTDGALPGADAKDVAVLGTGGASAGAPGAGGLLGTGGRSLGTGGVAEGGATVPGKGGSGGSGSGGLATGGAPATGGNGSGGVGGAGGIGDGGMGTRAGGRADAAMSGTGGVILDGGWGGGSGGTLGAGGATGSPCPATPPTNGAACGAFAETCYYEECAGKGRTLADCPLGVWKVSTGPCSSQVCGSWDGRVSRTCAAGEVCYGWCGDDARCTPHTCGAGPITKDCVPGATGYCTLSGSISDGIRLQCQSRPGTGC